MVINLLGEEMSPPEGPYLYLLSTLLSSSVPHRRMPSSEMVTRSFLLNK